MDNTTNDMSNDLRTIFWAEADKRLLAITDNLDRMQAALAPEEQFSLLGEMFADIQSLRGAAALVDQPDIGALSQSLEDVLARLRYDNLQLTPNGYDIFRRALVTSREVINDPQGRHAKNVADAVEALAVVAEDGVQTGFLIEGETGESTPVTFDEPSWTLPAESLVPMLTEEPHNEESETLSMLELVPSEPSLQAASEDEPVQLEPPIETTAVDTERPLLDSIETAPQSETLLPQIQHEREIFTVTENLVDQPESLDQLRIDVVDERVEGVATDPAVEIASSEVLTEHTAEDFITAALADDTTTALAPEPAPAEREQPSVTSLQSMVSPELMDAVRAAFRGEADEHLESLETGLLALEQVASEDERDVVLERTFRSAHSLKGAARAVGLTDVQSICQAIEDVFAGLKRRELHLSSDSFDVMHRALDAVNALLAEVEAPEVQQQIDDTIDQLRMLVDAAQPDVILRPLADEPEEPLPSSPIDTPTTVPVDIAKPTPSEVQAPQQARRPVAPPVRAKRQVEQPDVAGGRFTGETIRVATAKLDALLLQAEEMLAVRQAAGERTIDLREILSSLGEWRKEWNKVSTLARKFQRIYEGIGEQARQEQPHLSLAHRILEFLYWNESHLRGLESSLKNVTRAAERDHKQAGSLIGRLLDDTKKVLMLPFASLLNSFPKMVRDLSRTLQKDVELRMQGTEVEIDKRILDAIKDPIIHLLRNCVDHGIELPAERVRQGKATRGTVSIMVTQVGVSKVEIQVTDDGGGVKQAAVVAAAVKKGLLSEQEASTLDERAALGLIFQSGVSTSATVTDLSGRGLGMAIVREKVERLGGQIWVDSKTGEGTTFRILLPLTLATFRGFFVETRGSTFVIPTMNVERVVRIRPSEIKFVEDVETVTLNGRPVGLAYLSQVLDIPAQEPTDTTPGFVRGLVLASGDRRVLFCVDQIINEQEVLFKSLGTYLTDVPNVAGVTVLGSGKVVPILDVPNLVRSAIDGTSVRHTARTEAPVRVTEKHSVLLAEDSVTSRMLLKGILESAGYEVITAVDGLDALSQLGRRTFDLVVPDVEMPRMSGFELTASIRSHEKYLHLPVVLVTGLESRGDRERGMEAGASAYIVKGDFTQNDLLKTVQRFIPTLSAAA